LEQQPKSHERPIKNQVVRATVVAAALLTTVMVISIIWSLWRDVIRVDGNSDYVLRAVITVVGIWILIRIGSLYEWTGFGERVLEKSETREIQPRRTLWDWMSLLLVPLMIAGIASFFTWWQNNSQQAQEERQRARLAESQAQFTSVQAYLDQMNNLMLEKGLLLSEEGDTVFTLAQARTTTTLAQLDGEHNQSVTRFLSDSGLLREPPLLAKTDLEGAELPKAVLPEANLEGTNLSRANLANANLNGAAFSATEKEGEGITLIAANLTRADLTKASLQGANLSECHLKEAALTDATLQSADLSSADLQGADLSHAALQGANLSPATVPGFPGLKIPTNLTNADLSHAALQGANLSSADLTDANLSGAKGWTTEQLTAARSLEGAIMPNGQKYEDWLKDNQG
jgi:uncharacterized protein YjbI with pentapeptide repeats